MNANTLSITLSDSTRAFVEDQVRAGGHSGPSEYLERVLHDLQKKQAEERLESMMLEGLNSGDPIPVTEEFWAERRRRLQGLKPGTTA